MDDIVFELTHLFESRGWLNDNFHHLKKKTTTLLNTLETSKTHTLVRRCFSGNCAEVYCALATVLDFIMFYKVRQEVPFGRKFAEKPDNPKGVFWGSILGCPRKLVTG